MQTAPVYCFVGTTFEVLKQLGSKENVKTTRGICVQVCLMRTSVGVPSGYPARVEGLWSTSMYFWSESLLLDTLKTMYRQHQNNKATLHIYMHKKHVDNI